MAHIFISYKHENADFAAMLVQQLENAGFIAWIDRERLRAGEDWRQAIDKAIRESFALIVIMTPEAKASEYVTYEWACALGMGVKVVPLLLERTTLHPRLEVLQHLDFSDYDRRPWDHLTRQLEEFERDYVPVAIADTLNAPPVIREAILALDSPNADTRRTAVQKLSRMNHRAARAALSESVLLRDPDWQVRVTALEALGQFTEGRAPLAVINALHDTVSYVREAAVRAIGEIKDASAIPAILELIDASAVDSVREVRELKHVSVAVKEVLRGFGTAAVEYLDDLARASDKPYQRLRVARALGYIGYAGVPTLIHLLEDEQREVCMTAVQSLQRIGDKRAGAALIKVLRGDDRELRSHAMRALVAVRDPHSVPHIITALQDPDPDMREMAAHILGIFGDHSAVAELALALRDPEDSVREAALGALLHLPDPLAIPALLECACAYPSSGVLTVLMKLNHELSMSNLVELLHHENTETIGIGVVLLGEQRTRSALPALISLLEHDDATVRSASACALGSIGDPAAIPALAAAYIRENAIIDQGESVKWVSDRDDVPDDGTSSIRQPKDDGIDLGFLWDMDYDRDIDTPQVEFRQELDLPRELRHYITQPLQQAVVSALVRINTDESARELVNCLWDHLTVSRNVSDREKILINIATLVGGLKRTVVLEHLFNKLRMPEFEQWLETGQDEAGMLADIVSIIVSPVMERLCHAAAVDPHALVRFCAAVGFAKLKQTAPLEQIMRSDPMRGLREYAANVLFKLGWLPPDRAARVAFALATRNIVDCIKLGEATVPGLIDLLDVATGDELMGVIAALGKIGDRRAINSLVRVILSGDASARSAVNEVLSAFGFDLQAFNPVVYALATDDPALHRGAAFEGVKGLFSKEPEVYQSYKSTIEAGLLDRLRTDTPEAQLEALEYVVALRLSMALPLLPDLLKSPDGEVRLEALLALAELGGMTVASTLVPLLTGDDARMVMAALYTLLAIGWQPDETQTDPQLSALARSVIAAFGKGEDGEWQDEHIPDLMVVLLHHPAPIVRMMAVTGLGEIGSPAAVTALLQALQELPEDDFENEAEANLEQQ